MPDPSPEDEINDLLIRAIKYFDGDGLEQSNSLALECLDKAIEKGSVIAIYNKAISYIIGYGGLDKDFEIAEKLLLEATDKGHQEAFHWLALIDDGTYDQWINIPPNFFAQMEIAGGETGNIGGYYEAGMKYYTGFDGTEVPDFKEAFDLFIEAASQGHHEAQFMVGNMFENGNGIIKDQKKALLWYYKAADAGNANACYYLGLNFFEGRDGKIDFVEASSWFKKAAEMGHLSAMYNYGICCHVKHSNDLLGYADEAERSLAGLKWFETASSYNHLNSQILAALLYISGDPYPFNLEKALVYSMLAADQGDSSVYDQIINDDTESMIIDDEFIQRAKRFKQKILN
jgi:TPR repeat protein